MGKVVYLDPVNYVRGRITKRDRTVYNYRQSIDCRYTSAPLRMAQNPTAAQTASISKFRQTAQQTNTIMMDIDALEPYRTAWRNTIKSGNLRYRTLRGYIFAQVYRTL